MDLLFGFVLSAILSAYYPASAAAQGNILPAPSPEASFVVTVSEPAIPSQVAQVRTVTMTAYSSSVDETDDTPFITAANTRTRDGIVAANFLPFGAKIRIPGHFGDKEFVVEDRMHARFSNRVDVWFPTKQQALNFGIQEARVEIIALGTEF